MPLLVCLDNYYAWCTGCFFFSELVQGRDNRDFIHGRWVWATPLDSSSHCRYGRQLPNSWGLPIPPHFPRTLFLFYLFFFPMWMWLCALWVGHFLREYFPPKDARVICVVNLSCKERNYFYLLNTCWLSDLISRVTQRELVIKKWLGWIWVFNLALVFGENRLLFNACNKIWCLGCAWLLVKWAVKVRKNCAEASLENVCCDRFN